MKWNIFFELIWIVISKDMFTMFCFKCLQSISNLIAWFITSDLYRYNFYSKNTLLTCFLLQVSFICLFVFTYEKNSNVNNLFFTNPIICILNTDYSLLLNNDQIYWLNLKIIYFAYFFWYCLSKVLMYDFYAFNVCMTYWHVFLSGISKSANIIINYLSPKRIHKRQC